MYVQQACAAPLEMQICSLDACCGEAQACLSVQVLIRLHQHSLLFGFCIHAGHLEEDRH